MYTIEMAEKALSKKRLDEITKGLKLGEYKADMALSEELAIPFRIVRDNRRAINPYYPQKLYDLLPFSDWLAEAHPELLPEFNMDSYSFLYGNGGLYPDIESSRTPRAKKLWREYEESQGRYKTEEQRKFYFAHFYKAYDFDSFTETDFYGRKNHKPEEIEAYRQQCKDIQADFLKNPDKYYNDIPPEKPQ